VRAQMIAAAVAIAIAASDSGCSTAGPPPAAPGPTVVPTPASGCSLDPAVRPGMSADETLASGGRTRKYILSIPAEYKPSDPAPVILAYHGRRELDSRMETTTEISKLPVIAIYPEGTGGTNGSSWEGAPYSTDANDVQFTTDLLNDLESKYCVDAGRIYATGISNGGGFTSLLACQLADRIAAFASLSGAYYPQTTTGCEGSAPVPMLEFHGTGDPIIHYDGGVSHGESYLSVPDFMKRWADKDGCSAIPLRTQPVSGVELQTWQHCKPGTTVQHYRIDGGGHTWPGSPTRSGPGRETPTLPATQIIWMFFQQHPLSARG
jgi:polyhydroxybutyrate depolymerase